jgi:uncharacterized protein
MQWIDAFKLADSRGDRGPGAANHPHETTLQPGRAYGVSPRPAMRPENPLDWIAFIFLLVGAFAWGYYATQVNILTAVLSPIWDPLDELVFVLIASSGVYWLRRVFPRRGHAVGSAEDRHFQ